CPTILLSTVYCLLSYCSIAPLHGMSRAFPARHVAFEQAEPGEAFGSEGLRRDRRATSAATIKDDLLVPVGPDFLRPGLHLVVRQVDGTGNMALGVFRGAPDVEDQGCGVGADDF